MNGVISVVETCVTNEMNELLVRDVVLEEIETALKQMFPHQNTWTRQITCFVLPKLPEIH